MLTRKQIYREVARQIAQHENWMPFSCILVSELEVKSPAYRKSPAAQAYADVYADTLNDFSNLVNLSARDTDLPSLRVLLLLFAAEVLS